MCALRRFRHGGSVFFHRLRRIESQNGGNALRQINGRHIAYTVCAKQFLRLLRRQHNVFIVGQNNIFAVSAVFNGVYKFFHRRVHALPAADDFINALRQHNLRNAAACRHAYKARAFFFGYRLLHCRRIEYTVFVLLCHVVNFNIVQRAPFKCLLQNSARIGGMDMHFYNVIHCRYNKRIA